MSIAGGESFNGSDAVAATLASPVFALNDYGSTPFATAPGAFPNLPFFIQGPGGVLSQATQEINSSLKTPRCGRSSTRRGRALTIEAESGRAGRDHHRRPEGLGTVLQSVRGVHFGDISIQWWATQIQNLNASLDYIDPTHLPLYLTKDVELYSGKDPFNWCTGGFHGGNAVTIAYAPWTAER